ncbi:DUF4105 domain-containing protein [Emticicia sp. CRIBPO]|uniref:lipoprotein N-acyltransferase Lnb domain-containing protein n=1 Tax=Emticicia sp. CRIBPO TaxID=2683258 RepID=UPI0014132C79|nr:DUF4105 domain-containing protein [Emticicia sp. CRIBPO]NBA84156.1 DUF4105 domain-containing protein [Emticicia sp. CRIBPO]
MKKLRYLFSFLLLGALNSQAQQLSKEAQFGLVTISRGSSEDAIYQIWGHTVLHLNDPVNGINECYDYGSFTFDQPGFILKFMRGTLPYKMAVYDFRTFIDHYKYKENRSATEQILNLSPKQKEDLHQFLIKNYLPENREYKYRFFYYNCASRIRDILQQVCGDSLQFSQTLHADSSYRQWIDEYAREKQPWTNFGMMLGLGLQSDELTKESGAMFLPDNLAMGFDSAVIYHDKVKQPFVLTKIQHTSVGAPSISQSFWSPMVVLSLFLVLVAGFTWWQIRSGNKNMLFDKVLFPVLGLSGWFLAFLWFLTDHGVTRQNFNLIWAFPFLFPLFFFIKKNWITGFMKVYGIALAILLIGWKFWPQELPSPLIPLILAIILRVIFVTKIFKFKN